MATQGNIFTDTGFSHECSKGTIVAFDHQTGTYVPACAKWSTDFRADGSVIPDPVAYPLGVIISEVLDSRASVLCQGWTTDLELIQLLTNGGSAGEYYLGQDGLAVSGRASVTNLPVYCFNYRKSAISGDPGLLVFSPKPPEYAGHSHARYDVTAEWIPASDIELSDIEIPDTAKYVADVSADDALVELLTINPYHPTLLKNGVELSEGSWGVVSSKDKSQFIIYANFDVINGVDVFVLHAISPLTAQEPLVRSIQASRNCNLLDVRNAGGNVKIQIADSAVATDVVMGTGVLEVGNGGIKTGPIVQRLFAGPGIAVKTYNDGGKQTPGAFIISNNAVSKSQHDFLLCNLDGAIVGSSTSATSFVFPAFRAAKIHGNIRVPFFEPAELPARINLVVRGTSASGESLSLRINRQTMPSTDAQAINSVVVEYKFTEGSVGGDPDKLYLISAVDVPVSANDLLICTLSANNPTSSVEVVSMSLELA